MAFCAPSAQAADDGAGATWTIVRLAGEEVQGAAELTVSPDGGISGTSGCNSFSGRLAQIDAFVTTAGPLAVTTMACPPDLAAQEDVLLSYLQGPLQPIYDLLRDQLHFLDDDGEAVIILSRSK